MTWLTTRRLAAILAIVGAGLVVAGVSVVFGVPGGLISGGVFLLAAAFSNL